MTNFNIIKKSRIPCLINVYLNCFNNELKELPELSNSLTYLDCSHNKLYNLPTIPNSLKLLDCEYNKLSNIPTLPKSLKALNCHNNKLPYKNIDSYKNYQNIIL